MVNTFIIGDFDFCAQVLDKRRKLKQAVEAKQIIDIITQTNKEKKGFSNHPAVIMWKPYCNALILYYNKFIEQLLLDKVNLVKLTKIDIPSAIVMDIEMPWFLTFMPFIYSHRARLYQKDPEFYKNKFEFPQEYLSIGYIWPARHNKEYYIERESRPSEIADKLNILYVDARYCPAILKSGKRKGQPCSNILKSKMVNLCGVHNK